MNNYLLLFTAIVALIAGFIFGRGTTTPKTATTEIQTDTLVIRDTVSLDKPVPVAVTRIDKILVPVTDTVVIHDTIFVVLTREQKYYRGDKYEAWVSGYQPTLDRINVFAEDRVITNTVHVKQPYSHRLAVFAQTTYCGSFITPVGIDYEYSKNRWAADLRIGYDPINKNPFMSMGARFNIIMR